MRFARSIWYKLIILAALVLSGSYAFAGAYGCSGNVTVLSVDSAGHVYLGMSGVSFTHKLCNLSVKGTYATDVYSCAAIHATLLAAKLATKTVSINYNDSSYSTCLGISANGANSQVTGTILVDGPN